jgi:hypothetical protein
MMARPIRDEIQEIIDNFPQCDEMLDALAEYTMDRMLRSYGQGMRFADQGHAVPTPPTPEGK